jgi:hypothetical protein
MALPESARALFRPPFRNYQFDAAYDEMFEGPGVPRPHYQALFQTLLELPPEEMRKSQPHSELSVAVTVSPSDAPPPEQTAPSIVIQSRPVFARVNSRAEQEQQQQQ